MAPDIEQTNFLLWRPKHQGDTVGVSQTDRMQTFQRSLERMQPQVRLERIRFRVTRDFRRLFYEFGAGTTKFGYAAVKVMGRDQRVHQSSRPRSSSSSGGKRIRTGKLFIELNDLRVAGQFFDHPLQLLAA